VLSLYWLLIFESIVPLTTATVLSCSFYAKVSDLHTEVYKSQETAMANPLVAFTLIKRLHSEWLNVVYSDEALENTQALRSSYEKEEAGLPKLEDLQGAAKGLMRLQDVYALQVASLVRGHFRSVTNGQATDIYMPDVSVPLSGDDCFLVGKVAYDQEDYYHSVQWLEESVRLFRGSGGEWSPENEGTLKDALDHLAFSHFKTGNVSYALSLSQELLHHDPVNGRVLQNVEKYEKLLMERPHISNRGGGLRRPASKYLRTRNTYERLCQTQGSQPVHFENPRLFCDYFTSGSPGLLLGPVKREVLSLQPYVVLYHDFITDAEAEDIKMLAQPGLRRSVVAAGEKQATADYRISKSAWVKDSAHSVVGKLDQRISLLTGLNVTHPYGEYLQVVNYGIGGHYEPHFDHATSPSSPVFKLKTGNRVATFMIYSFTLGINSAELILPYLLNCSFIVLLSCNRVKSIACDLCYYKYSLFDISCLLICPGLMSGYYHLLVSKMKESRLLTMLIKSKH
uniref:Prolyl 4-hydroxylase, alpha polypeptide III n=1 Tax=Sphaeramia orbicularis TaxID=375764 RepID=A0A672YF46_9TELE